MLDSNVSRAPSEVCRLKEYAISVDEELAMWPLRQIKQWQPKTIGYVTQREHEGLLEGTTSSPKRIDTYFDRKRIESSNIHILKRMHPTVYVSAVWNSYRKSRLVLLDFIYTCSERLPGYESEGSTPYTRRHILKEARNLSETIAASIPFHLTRNPEVFCVGFQQAREEIILPNPSVGGLLLMHSIYAASCLSIVPERLREMFREHLRWIGQKMGIGQAGLLADVSTSLASRSDSQGCSVDGPRFSRKSGT